jgi:hypothetical protein
MGGLQDPNDANQMTLNQLDATATAAIPEPGSATRLLFGLSLLAGGRRLRRARLA